MKDVESGLVELSFDEQGLIPVITQDHETKDVLMLAYATREAVDLTQKSGYAHYYSRSRKKIWKKGEESGNLQKVYEIRVDCDADTLIYIVSQQCAACHTGHWTCFYRTISGKIIADRLFEPDKVYNKSNE
ncbi:phosphoribosyl-AMP cyclohydrolase [Methanospirillum lacunae]|uniref:Phosphoribosyl-AMP cyclohydrolase n=1 Tax=Methanospirillum lacunae TaxID=668570 RepID=A0A2V2MX21_9EURY|nr:phosphoribosyl-AMP cyclohydrolase [Methanospirillum lacunae]PWR72704.1 phosphoribosyl-AMP cyclohydrolase [Methanospirillum lacunae]